MIKLSRRTLILQGTSRKDGRALQRQTAEEILAEVFGIRIFEVDEMIANRFLNCPDVVIFRNRGFNNRLHISL